MSQKKVVIVEDEALIAHNLQLMLKREGYIIAGIADNVPDALRIVGEQKPDIVLVDIALNGPLTGLDLGEKLAGQNIPFIYLSANFQDNMLEKVRTTEPYGFLIKPFRDKELLMMMDVVFYRYNNTNDLRNKREEALEQALNAIVSGTAGWKEKAEQLARSLQPYIPFECINIRPDDATVFPVNGLMLLRMGFDRYKIIEPEEYLDTTGLSRVEATEMINKSLIEPGIFNDEDFDRQKRKCAFKRILASVYLLESGLHFSVINSEGKVTHFMFYSRKADGYAPNHQKLLLLAQLSLARSIEHITRLRIAKGPAKTTGPDNNQPGATASVFTNIVGSSSAILEVLDHISVAAPLDTSVLILGESGTGKERIAKSIHQLSPRKNSPLIIINCASLPANLIESELFGHEKGSFTGAIERRKGKFEMADKGTIFLDEIGEMPIEMQVRLLRVLQEREIERVGGSELIRVDVRVIAATSRDLEKEVKEGKFRLDLYYRLCVYPIEVPALREREGDIILLADHFIEKYSKKLGKTISGLSVQAQQQLLSHEWPGNVRELENSIERTLMRTTGPIMEQISIFSSQPRVKAEIQPKTMEDNLREVILDVLKKCNGKIGGPGGAAEHLRMPATTLHSKMKKLGIKQRILTTPEDED
jgi:DNA-binding NtrC family response regulator